MASYVGSKIELTASDGVYVGIIHSMDERNSRITLDKVVAKKSGSELCGLVHFFGKDIEDIIILENSSKKKEIQDDQGPTVMRRKLYPQHLKNLKDIDYSELTLRGRQKKISGYNSSNNASGDDFPHSGQAHSADEMVINSSTRASRLAKYEVNRHSHKNKSSAIDNQPKQLTSKPTDNDVPKSTDKYTILDEFGDLYNKALEHIKQQKFIGLAVEGVNIGRTGKLCWLQIGCPDHVFLFDVLKLGTNLFTSGMTDVLQDGKIQKIAHDCRYMSDMFFHKYKTKMQNLFDTQVASVMVYKLFHGGDLPRYVQGLPACLFEYLELSQDQVFIQRARESSFKEDMAVWAERPTSSLIIDAAVKNVCYLRDLRSVLHQKMLTDFIDGVDIYLSLFRDAKETDDVQMRQKHVLPPEFQDIHSCAEERRLRFLRFTRDDNVYDDRGFRENCPGLIDPLVKFSHDGCWHAGSGTVHRIPSPDPLSFKRRGRAKIQDKARSRSRSRNRPTDDMSITALGSAELRKQNMPDMDPTMTTYTEALAPQPDIEKIIDMQYIVTPTNIPQEKDKPRHESQVASTSLGKMPRGFNVIAAGAESTSGIPKHAEMQSEGPSLPNGEYIPEDQDYEEKYDVIPGSQEAIKLFKEKPLFSSTFTNHVSSEKNNSAFTRVTPNSDRRSWDNNSISHMDRVNNTSQGKESSASSYVNLVSPKNEQKIKTSPLLRGLCNNDSDSDSVKSVGRGRAQNLHNMLKNIKIGSGMNKEQSSDSDKDTSVQGHLGLGRAKALQKYGVR